MRISISSLCFTLLMLACLMRPVSAFEVHFEKAKVQIDGVEKKQWEELESLLLDQLTLSGGEAGTEPLADDLAFFTRQFYVQRGWPKAEVKWLMEGDGIRLAVTPGEQVRVGKILIKGETGVPEEELTKYLLKPTLERPDTDKSTVPWVDADLQQGVGLVQRRLRAEGFLNAETTLVPALETDAEMRRDLTLEIKPGPKFAFGHETIKGAPPELAELVQEQMDAAEGTPFNEARVQQIQQRLVSICTAHGWLHAAATADYVLGSEGGTVDVRFLVTPGERVKIALVTAHPGFSKGAQRVLRAEFRPLEGRIYESKDADFFFRKALDTQMFTLLDTEVLPVDGDPALGNLRISGEEARPHTLGFEIGFDTFLGAQAGVTYKNTNWRDSGNTLAAGLSYSLAGPLGDVSFTNPAVFDSRYASTIRLALEQFNRYEYDRLGSSLNLDVSRRASAAFSYSLFVGASASSVSTPNLTPQDIGPANYSLATIGANLLYDRRDSLVLAKKGWYVALRAEESRDLAGSGLAFSHTDLKGAWYRPITKKFRFAAGAEFESIQGASAEQIPIDSRVFSGGPNSVRSFAQRELGPLTPGRTPLGGTAALTASAEFSYEIIENLEFAVFGDIGSLARGENSSPFSYSSDYREAVGVGLRYHLPFGPIRIDYGRNPNPRAGERSGTLHIAVGFAF